MPAAPAPVPSANGLTNNAHPEQTTCLFQNRGRPASHLDATNTMTLDNGAPVADYVKSLQAGPNGPLLMQDYQLFDKLARFNRERIPERIVHAHGAGAYGYFQVTNDITKYCKADVFKPGQKTPVFCRFSTVRGGKDSTEANRDPRGFSVKHYTNEGVWDFVGNNTPIFFIRHPNSFVDLIHVFKNDPHTGMPNFDNIYDWVSNTPESIHQVVWLMGPRGLPAGWIHMNGYSGHTFKMVNKNDEQFWVKLHYLSNNGMENHTQDQADGKGDPFYHTRELYTKLEKGEQPSWTLKIQVIPVEEAKGYKWNLFDLTKVIPHSDYPLIEVGKLYLTDNPTSVFAETEQSSFSPSNLVPGLEPSPDPILQSRLWSYNDAHRYRVGANYQHVPVNCPFNRVRNNDQDGRMCPFVKQGANYFPNTQSQVGNYHNGVPDSRFMDKPVQLHGSTGERFEYTHPNSDFEQPAMLWNKVFSDADRAATVQNFSETLKPCRANVQEKMFALLTKVDPALGDRVRKAVEKLPASKAALH